MWKMVIGLMLMTMMILMSLLPKYLVRWNKIYSLSNIRFPSSGNVRSNSVDRFVCCRKKETVYYFAPLLSYLIQYKLVHIASDHRRVDRVRNTVAKNESKQRRRNV